MRTLSFLFGLCFFVAASNAQDSATNVLEDKAVFRKLLRKAGDDNSKSYRIPGLATSNKGTLLAVFDIRYNGSGDLPGDIDVGLMRSTDHGETWQPMQRIMDYDKSVANSKGNGVGDPTILVDKKTGDIYVAALWSQGNRAWNGSGPGLTPEQTGQFVIAKSSDDGLTWSTPMNITTQIKDPAWKLCFQGPGAGIQDSQGRLIFPAQFRDPKGVPHSCFIYSQDSGKTWKITPPAIPAQPPTSESQLVELADGSILLSMRNEAKSGLRAWATWQWDSALPTGGKWSEHWLNVPDPTCMASLMRHPQGLLLFANPNSARHRVALTIRTSKDNGKTWSNGRLLDPGGSMYSCMTTLDDGRIGILYESSQGLTFARFPLEWVTAEK